jgi:hypothetical protein
MVAEKVVREGMYGEYEVDLIQQRDDARSTFKPAKETKSKKGAYSLQYRKQTRFFPSQRQT